jgi:hypothetical protein
VRHDFGNFELIQCAEAAATGGILSACCTTFVALVKVFLFKKKGMVHTVSLGAYVPISLS